MPVLRDFPKLIFKKNILQKFRICLPVVNSPVYKFLFRLLVFFISCFYTNTIFCQAPSIEWQKTFGGSNFDSPSAIQQTKDGGYIVAGSSQSTDGDINVSFGALDGWVVKIDAVGNIQWKKTLGGSKIDVINAIKQTSDDGYIISGATKSTTIPGYHGGEDAWVVRLDAAGNILWEKAFGGTNDDWFQAVQQTSDGGYIFGGVTKSNNGDVSGFHGDVDGWVLKLDINGNIQWQRTLGGTDSDQVQDIQQTTDGGYIVAAVSFSIDGDVSFNHGFSDYWIIKLNAAGSITWQQVFGGSSTDEVSAIQQTTDGGYIVAGESLSIDGDITNNNGVTDAWLVKIDATGNLTWQKSFGGTGLERAVSVDQTIDGGYVFAGITLSNDGDVSGNHGSLEGWLVKLDLAGNLTWQKTLGGSSDDFPRNVQETSDGGYIVCVLTKSNDGDVSGNHGNQDYWVVKLCNNPAMPANITGNPFPCINTLITYSIPPLSNANSYTWTVPTGWTIVSGQGTTSINATVGNNSGDIKVAAINNCGNSPTQILAVKPTSATTPKLTITATTTTICQGSSITFTATATNGGTTPIYQWKKNGINTGTNNTTYTNASLNNGDVITCELTSNDPCATPKTANSNSINITVTAATVPAITIVSNTNSICSGSPVTLTASATNGGTSPSYHWKKNGVTTGTNNATYTDASLNNGDVITCELTSNDPCNSSSTATSNAININVSSSLTPTISITSTSTTICSNNNVTFTATATNGGTSPVYQWKKNGINAGNNSTVYSDASLSDNDIITCELTSSESCITTATVMSNTITITASSAVTPAINITSTATNICPSTSVTFTATTTNGGSSPTYQWKKNGINVGNSNTTYIDASLNNNDLITCELTSSESCLTSAKVISNTIRIITDIAVVPSINITASATDICPESSITFTATATNGGDSPIYQWKKNGTVVGSNNAVYTTSSLNNADIISCELTTSATCVSINSALSNSIKINVVEWEKTSVNIISSATTICKGDPVVFTANASNAGPSPIYQWQLNGNNVGANNNSYTGINLSDNDNVICTVTPQSKSCSADVASSNVIFITINPLPVISISPLDTLVSAGSQVQLNAAVNGNIDSYQWSPSSALLNASTLSPFTTALKEETGYTFTVRSVDGCYVSKNTIVKISKPLLIPNSFTPNGDRVNDVFRIPVNAMFKLKDISIYNRWGQKVFFSKDINKGWDGLNHPLGIYTYFIDGLYNNEPIFIKGVVTLIR